MGKPMNCVTTPKNIVTQGDANTPKTAASPPPPPKGGVGGGSAPHLVGEVVTQIQPNEKGDYMAKDITTTADQLEKAERETPRLKFEFGEDKKLDIAVHGDYARLFNEPVGKDVIVGLIHHISVQGSYGKTFDEEAANFALAFVDSMQPADAAEAVLLTQMAATHQAMMMMTRRLNHVQTLQQQDSAERAVNKLGRTFAAQMETLKRYRSKGQQVVRVERVMVAEGGQAIVGNVETGGRGR
ncbi:MAG: hypothetical protein ACU0A4_09405 [Paracoccaceae bacterium]